MYKSIGTVAFAIIGASAAALGMFNIDPSSISVSGLSAGGFMSAQLGIAFSDIFVTGFGVFAGGPYDCARNQSVSSCTLNASPSITKPLANMKAFSGNQIAPLANLKSRKIFMQVGSADTVVGPNVMAQLKAQLANFNNASNTSFVTTSGAEHTFPTDFDGDGDNPCGAAEPPFISNCGFDGAGAVLQKLYGNLNARNDGAPMGNLSSFAQTGSFGSAGLDTTGFVYVPRACQSGSRRCKLHVAMHGCAQSADLIGTKFITNTGYTKHADTNNIILLFPQAVVDPTPRTTFGGAVLGNPTACFDWFGLYGTNCDQIGGVQMTAVVNMVKQLVSGGKNC